MLIIAHPGHELLLHHWVGKTRPLVAVLTDGSGSRGQPRLEATRRTLTQAGARTSNVFGVGPDQRFYDAILEGDLEFFRAIIAGLEEEIVASGATAVVSDPIEYFSPVHDLCSVLASLATVRATPQLSAPPHRFTFPIERPADLARAAPDWRVTRLTPMEYEAKRRAAELSEGLEQEVARVSREQPGVGSVEVLMPVRPEAALMPAPMATPFYETFGRARVGDGAFTQLITYADHVAPLVEALAACEQALDPAAAD